jgi:two-component system, NarL family, nitrate/nitrite response regulator NarL
MRLGTLQELPDAVTYPKSIACFDSQFISKGLRLLMLRLSTPDARTQSVGRRIRIVLVDDHQIVRQGIRMMITDARPTWEVCAEAGNGEEAIEAIKKFNPDVVILDVTMPVRNGFETARYLKESGSKTRIIMLTMHESTGFLRESRNAGADGYVSKTKDSKELVKAIESVLSGGTFFPQAS